MLIKKETLQHLQMGCQGSSNPLNFKAELVGMCASVVLWMEAFITTFLSPGVTAVGKFQAQRDATICQSQKKRFPSKAACSLS